MKLSNWWNVWFFWCNIRGEFLVGKVLISACILCKFLRLYTRVAQKVFNINLRQFLRAVNIALPFRYSKLMFCRSIRNCIAYAICLIIIRQTLSTKILLYCIIFETKSIEVKIQRNYKLWQTTALQHQERSGQCFLSPGIDLWPTFPRGSWQKVT